MKQQQIYHGDARAKKVSSGTVLTGFYPKLKSFWSCSHMSCCRQNISRINLHILYIIHIRTRSKIQESNKYIKSYQQNKLEVLDKYYFALYFI